MHGLRSACARANWAHHSCPASTCRKHSGECNVVGGVITDPGSNFGLCVSIDAPAHYLRVAHMNSDGGAYPQWSGYRTDVTQRSGTSFAVPFVAGMVARLLEKYPGLPAAPELNPSNPSLNVWTYLKNRALARNPQPADIDPSSNINHLLVYMSDLD
ncbi:MAG: S8 family serine peptidase [Thermoanaerobaculia bacterium]